MPQSLKWLHLQCRELKVVKDRCNDEKSGKRNGQSVDWGRDGRAKGRPRYLNDASVFISFKLASPCTFWSYALPEPMVSFHWLELEIKLFCRLRC